MEKEMNKKPAETKEKGTLSKKKNDQEKKTKSDTTTFTSNFPESSIENIVVVGKSCNIIKSKSHESGYRLHECRSKTILVPLPDSQNLMEHVSGEGVATSAVFPSLSNTSFISAKSDVSNSQFLSREEEVLGENGNDSAFCSVNHPTKDQLVKFDSVPVEKDTKRFKDVKKKMTAREKRIKDMTEKIEESKAIISKKISENRALTHQVNVLNRQLQSMYELVSQKNWNQSIDATEFLKYKNKATELESIIVKLEEEKKELQTYCGTVTSHLDTKEKELNGKNKELIEYKNRSTLEMCKLIGQIDSLKRDMNTQSQIFDSKIIEAQNSVDDEVVRITMKLEHQYQQDLKTAIDKLRSDFQQLSTLPESAIEKLLQVCGSSNVDLVTLQKDWNRQQKILENKILSLEIDHSEKMTHLKDSYEMKIVFLKTQVESLSSQLLDSKETLEVFESKLRACNGNSPLRSPRSLPFPDSFLSLQELYKAEILAQKEVHNVEINLFEKMVKTLSEEILYHAKNEENHLLELENSRKIARIYREKYEQLAFNWGEKVERSIEVLISKSMPNINLDDLFEYIKGFIHSWQKVEEMHDKSLRKLKLVHNDEIDSYKQDIEILTTKLSKIELLQRGQIKLDNTIQELIESIGCNFMKTVEALVTGHLSELTLKQLEICCSEKRYLDEMSSMQNNHRQEIEELQNKFILAEEARSALQNELNLLKQSSKYEEVNSLKTRTEEISLEILKYEKTLAIKEEMERVLNERIKELEDLIKVKEENFQKETENLVAKLVEVEVLSSAKDEVNKELEEKLDDSEKLLGKSCNAVDDLCKMCVLFEKNFKNVDSELSGEQGDFVKDAETISRFALMQATGEKLKRHIIESFEFIDCLEAENTKLEQNGKKMLAQAEENILANSRKLEDCLKLSVKEKKEALQENYKLQIENNSLRKEIAEKNRIIDDMKLERGNLIEASKKLLESNDKEIETKQKLKKLEIEREEYINKGKLILAEKADIEERNRILEADLKLMRQKIGQLMTELENNKEARNEVYSISLQEVRVLYEETLSDIERSASASTVAIQAQISESDFLEDMNFEELRKENKKLREENKNLKVELENKCVDRGSSSDIISNLKKELSEVLNEKYKWETASKSLEMKNEVMKKEIENLREENYVVRASCEAELKIIEEKMGIYLAEHNESDQTESKIDEMRKQMGKLNSYIETLSSKLNLMLVNNEKLLNQSTENLKNNQNLTSELEEAWAQRYEIEDQLAKVRKENAMLNTHLAQLDETNRRISNLVNEGKPAIVSWLKTHENIVDEVLALKISLSDSVPSELEISKTQSELKSMKESLHAQLHDKTILCDELLIQKKSLEKELKDLEELLKQNDSRILNHRQYSRESSNIRRNLSDIHNNQSNVCQPEVRSLFETDRGNLQDSEILTKECGESHLRTLNLLKKHLENQVELEEAHFRENLELGIQELKKEIQNLEDDLQFKESSLSETATDIERDLALIEMNYEKDVLRLSEEFRDKVEKLKSGQSVIKFEGKEQAEEEYNGEIDKIRFYFQEKWTDLERRYQEMYNVHDKKRLDCALEKERQQILTYFKKIIEKKDEKIQIIELEDFLMGVLNKYIDQIKNLQNKYKENISEIESKHAAKVKNLETVINELKEDSSKEETNAENLKQKYEGMLEVEKKRITDLIEEMKQKHEKEIFEMEEFWTEKLSECETKCAVIKAATQNLTEKRKFGNENHANKLTQDSDIRKSALDVSGKEQDQQENIPKNLCSEIYKYTKEYSRNISSQNTTSRFEDGGTENSGHSSSLGNASYFARMEMETDDDKLQLVRERDSLKEMVFSLRHVVTKLISFVGQYGKDVNNYSLRDFDHEDTLYKSILFNTDDTQADLSVVSNNALLALDISSLIQEINNHSLLNPSHQVRFELDKCLKQVKKDATGLLALSNPDNSLNLNELIKKIEKETNNLEEKVSEVEKLQDDIRKEIGVTKQKFMDWERNLEVVSEGYGEGVVEPKKIYSFTEIKEKIKLFLAEQFVQPPQEINILDEICKEGDRLQEEWKREKFDLQQQARGDIQKFTTQIDVADKQLQSLKKFMEEQATEREQERDAFDKEINELKESLKLKERDHCVQNRTNLEGGLDAELPFSNKVVEALEVQVKELTNQISNIEISKEAVESEFQNAVKKIWSLREVIQDLEVQLAEVSERELNLKKKVDKFEAVVKEQTRINRDLKDELESCKNDIQIKYSDHIKHLEERLAEQGNVEALSQMKSSLRQIEAIIIKKTKDLEQMHVSSTNASCSSPSEDVSIRDHFDATRCPTPDEMCALQPQAICMPLEEIDRLHEKLARHTRAEEVAMKYIQDLKMQLRNSRKSYEELQTERDVLLERSDSYLKENSGLKVRLEEQRCNAAILQKQLNANLESQINRLEIDMEKLNELCLQKDKQLNDMKEILENTTKTLKMREAEALNKSKEENFLISTLKADLTNALNDKEKLEDNLNKVKEKLKNSVKIPALIDSIIEEKNAEIDRLEKEISRLSSEKLASSRNSMNGFNEQSVPLKSSKRIKFSEPESFGECISSISPYTPSIMRNCSDSYADFRNSSFKIRQPLHCSKVESLSSIGPLQLSPRGTNICSNWKTSSPIVTDVISVNDKSYSPKTDNSFEKMIEESKLQSTVESKQREISELKLEIDIFKRKLVEVSQEMETSRSQTKEVQRELDMKAEEIQKLKNNETNLLITLESLKRNHSEEVEELQNKLIFEHGKVEKVYEEIKSLEVKKIEIEEAFLSLKEDYKEKLNGEQKVVKSLIEKIKDLELQNTELEREYIGIKEEIEHIVKESKLSTDKLNEELFNLKRENEKLKCSSKSFKDSEAQVDDMCIDYRNNFSIEIPKLEGGSDSLKQILNQMKSEFNKITKIAIEGEFNRKEALTSLNDIKNLLHLVFENIEGLAQELDTRKKAVMESSVDDLALKVQKELLLSAKLDNELLSSIEAKNFTSKIVMSDKFPELSQMGGGDGIHAITRTFSSKENEKFESPGKTMAMYNEAIKKVTSLEKDRDELLDKVKDHQKIIKFLEESLSAEKERILAEKKRCKEDAKIMELLRLNLEKGLQDLKSKDKDLKKEKLMRTALEKEVENLRKRVTNASTSKRMAELTCQLESQEEKTASLSRSLESEKKKNQELLLSLEQVKIERISEKEAQRLLESDLTLLRVQKENLKSELVSTKRVLHSRDKEISTLKRTINLQEIDIKALSLSNNFNLPESSEVSAVINRVDSLEDVSAAQYRQESSLLNPQESISKSLLCKMKQLNTCVQRHVRESNEMGETLLHLSEETEHMKDLIKKLEENAEINSTDQTLVGDIEIERKLWDLEKGRLLLDVEALKNECELTRRHSLETSKNNELLRLENAKLKSEIKLLEKEASGHIESGIIKDRINHLMKKYLRAESYRKALAWQKNYLMIALNGYQSSEEEAKKKMIGRLGSKRKEIKQKGHRCKKIKVVALAVVVIFRMKYMVKRWQRPKSAGASLSGTQPTLANQNSVTSIINVYDEPINPLSYQIQNVFRRVSTSRVLRTPPSRDPGLQSCISDDKKISDYSEALGCVQESLGTAKILP